MSLAQRAQRRELLKQNRYEPHGGQVALLTDPHRFKVIRCGRRWGKTVYAVNHLITEAVLKGGDYWYVAPTYKQAKLIAWRLLLSYLPDVFIKKVNETELTVTLDNGSQISLKGADNPDSLRGVGIDGLVLDEYAFTDHYAWDVLRPLLTDRKGWVIFISTPNGYNHFYNLYNLENTDEAFKSFHFTSYDNPYLDGEELDSARKSMSEERFAQEYLAEFTKRAGTIWSFSRGIHLEPRRNPREDAVVFGSIDFGFAVGHATAVLWHELTSESVYTFDGFVEEGLTIDKIDEYMRAQTTGITVRGLYCDSARPDLIEELRRRGWPVIEARKDVELGIQAVARYMQTDPQTNLPRWTMSQHLTKAAQQVENYVWQEVRGADGMFKQVPRKENDDAPDALRYFIFTHTYTDAKEGEYRTYGGSDPITRAGYKHINKPNGTVRTFRQRS